MKSTILIAIFLFAGTDFVQSQNNAALIGSWTATSKTAKIYFLADGKGYQTIMKSNPIHDIYICNAELIMPFNWYNIKDTIFIKWDTTHFSVNPDLVPTTSQTLSGNPLKALTEGCAIAGQMTLAETRKRIPVKTKNRFTIEGNMLNYGSSYTRDE